MNLSRNSRPILRISATIALAYVLALQLLLTALAGATQAAERLDPTNPANPTVELCLPGNDSGQDGQRSATRHQTCCTIACQAQIAVPSASAVAVALGFERSSSDAQMQVFAVDRVEADPGTGRGPRAPPVILL